MAEVVFFDFTPTQGVENAGWVVVKPAISGWKRKTSVRFSEL